MEIQIDMIGIEPIPPNGHNGEVNTSLCLFVRSEDRTLQRELKMPCHSHIHTAEIRN
jgi:hypothetical protein